MMFLPDGVGVMDDSVLRYKYNSDPFLQESDLKVDEQNAAYGDQVYTVQQGGCGVPGSYIHITPANLLNEKGARQIWGPRGKVMFIFHFQL